MENRIHKAVIQACRNFMVPIARFLLRNGLSYKEFAEVAKWAFVHVASEDYGLRGRQTSISRVSFITGIPRKSAARLRRYEKVDSTVKESRWSAPSQILHVWHSDQQYLSNDGTPRALSVSNPDGFAQLTKSIGLDIPVGAILKEMKRTGSVNIGVDGMVTPRARHYIPQPLSTNSINYMGAALSNLASTLNRNLSPNLSDSPFFERSAYTNGLSPAKQDTVKIIVAKKGQRLLEEIDDVVCESSDRESGDEGMISGVGLYYFENSEIEWD